MGWGLLALVLAVFVVKTATYEAWYYDEKDGSERAVASAPESNLVEEEPTQDDKDAYLVPANRPRFLTVEKLGIQNARILPMGVNAAGELLTPDNVYDVGWYENENAGLPGRGGTMIIDGHNGGPHVQGIFKNLPSMTEGDIITIERGDGAKFNYRVMDSVTVPLAESDKYMAVAATSPDPEKESVTLISCTGEWSDYQQTYLSRQFVRAVLVEEE